jgi:acyl-CoA synthetase (AMP-forming)/AMP-acid ligase II
VAAYYGAQLAGGVAVPLNAAARGPEIVDWIAHAGAGIVVADRAAVDTSSLRERLQASAIVLEACGAGSPFDSVCMQGDPAEAQMPAGESPACIHYTSGTTGRPKGVLLSHANLASNAAAIVQYLALTAGDSIVSVLPFYYAYGSSVLHTHLLCGGRVVVEKGFSFPHVVMQRLATERATGFAGVPSTYALLMARVRLENYDLAALRYLTQAGGAMAPALIRQVVAAFPQARLYVMYGQTEATSRISYLPPDRLGDKLGSVGKGIAGQRVQIRDDGRKPLPSGQVGHVWVSGPNVMLGYWDNPDETARVLAGGWLDTGDMGYLDEEGFLFLVGRRSDIIKVGAHRVHPQDVESVIAELDAVAEAAVVGVDDPVLGEVVKAFVVRKEQRELSELEVRRHCLQRLASYKVPKSVAMVDSLPRTASGKVRRSELVKGESE